MSELQTVFVKTVEYGDSAVVDYGDLAVAP